MQRIIEYMVCSCMQEGNEMPDNEQTNRRAVELIEIIHHEGDRDRYWINTVNALGVIEELKSIGEPTIPLLINALAEAIPQTGAWEALIITLSRFSELALPVINSAWSEADANLRGAFVLVGSEVGESALPILTKALDDPDTGVRQLTVENLERIGKTAIDAFTKALDDENPDVRQKAVEGLGKIGDPALGVLTRALDHKDTDVRRLVVRWLTAKALYDLDEASPDAFIKALSDEDPTVRQLAVAGLGFVSAGADNVGESVLLALTKALDDPVTDVRQSAVKFLCSFGESALPALTAALYNEDAGVRQQAVEGLSRLGKRALAGLSQALKDEVKSVRLKAVEGLGQIGEPALKVLSKALDDENSSVRRLAVEELGKIGEPSLDALSKVLRDRDKDVQRTMLTSLIRIGKPAVRLITLALEEFDTKNSEEIIGFLELGADIELASAIVEPIVSELIIRGPDRPSSSFNYDVVARALQASMARNPRVRAHIQEELCSIALKYQDEIRQRAVLVAQRLDIDEFWILIRAKAHENPDAARDVMRLFGRGSVGRIAGRLSETDPGDVQRIAASQIVLLDSYYNAVLGQATTSFKWALVAAGIGLLFFLGAIAFLLTKQPNSIATVSIIGGAIVETIAGINFMLYGKTTAQLAHFHHRLDQTQRFLLANSICESLDGDVKYESRRQLVTVIATLGLESSSQQTDHTLLGYSS
jgi:HEAT repeat protein